MGMAASQARFLGLTARKSNVEYEGQQVNQQRTTLSNQSANYYNDMLGLSVPVPPSVDDYTKTIYTFEDGALTNEITAMIAKGNGKYTVSYLRQWTDDFSVVNASTSIINYNSTTGTYSIGSNQLRELGKTASYTINGATLVQTGKISTQDDEGNVFNLTSYSANGKNYYLYVDKDDSLVWYTDDSENEGDIVQLDEDNSPTAVDSYNVQNDKYLSTLSTQELQNLLDEEREYIALLQNKYGNDTYYVRYIKNTSTEEYEPYFYKGADFKAQSDGGNAIYDTATGNSQSSIACYKIGSEVKTDEVKAVPNCLVEKDSSGRYINITIPDASGNKITYALTTSTMTDQDAYNDAMNQYEYEKSEYDHAINDINSKIEIIQAQDKNLELRLKQLDTEQEAIQTEMDAVSGVIQKNTESSFKTFG